MKTRIVIADHQESLAPIVAKAVGASCITYTHSRFADSESYFTFSEKLTPGYSPLIVYRFSTQRTFNDQLFILILLLQKLKSRGISDIVLLLPYLPYTRQDALDEYGAPSLFYEVCSLFKELGVAQCIAYDIHSATAALVSPVPIHSVDMTLPWSMLIKTLIGSADNYVVAAADEGGKGRALRLAEAVGMEFVFINKLRKKADYVASCEMDGDVVGKHVILVDDILNTGRTAIHACQLLMDQGAQRVIGLFTHGIFSQGAIARLETSQFSSIYISDTVLFNSAVLPKNVMVVSIGNYIHLPFSLFTQDTYQKEAPIHGL